MGIEAASFISELNAANPLGTDLRSTADDHHRLVKSVLKGQFVNFSATAVEATVAEINLLVGVTSLNQIIEHGVVATTSGTEVEFASIPTGVKRITIVCSDVSTDGTDQILLQLGDSGGYESTGYSGAYSWLRNVTAVAVAIPISGFVITKPPSAGSEFNSSIVLTRVDDATNTWVIGYTTGTSAVPFGTFNGSGSKSLTATLDRIKLMTLLGTDAFDSGKVNLFYEK